MDDHGAAFAGRLPDAPGAGVDGPDAVDATDGALREFCAIFAALAGRHCLSATPHRPALAGALALYAALEPAPANHGCWPHSSRAVWVLPSIFALYIIWQATRFGGAAIRAPPSSPAHCLASSCCARALPLSACSRRTGVVIRATRELLRLWPRCAAGAAARGHHLFSRRLAQGDLCQSSSALAPADGDWVRVDGTSRGVSSGFPTSTATWRCAIC